jgi:hypothetical protein
MKHMRRLRSHGPKHRTALITAMGPRRGKSHENQLPNQLLGFYPSQACTGTFGDFSDGSGSVCYCLSIVINLKATV